MTRKIVLGILIAILLIGGAAAVGATAYRYGLVQGLTQAEKIQIVAPEAGVGPAWGMGLYGRHHFGHPFGFGPFGFGFGCLGFIFPLLFFFLLFGLIRRLVWGGWGWRRHGPWGHHPGEGHKGMPPMFEEWHRQAHGQSAESPKTE